MHDAYVIEAELALEEGFDPAAVGAAVTTELCGHWEHEGPCRWPHNSEIDAERDPASFRTVFVADEPDLEEVRGRVRTALGGESGWRVVAVTERAPTDAERPLAEKLLSGPRAT
ncbi:MAG TPA: hypothetical protein VJT68_08845 [Thermoleophilaceae bacterium]|nr:hypothetical protein [Thermoleophilaceae bacterium]